MKQTKLFGVILAFVLFHPVSAPAQQRGDWRASSKNAQAITGDVSLGTEKVVINLVEFPMSEIRRLTPVETKATFDLDTDPVRGGDLFRINIPATKKFLHKNSLCGADDAQWIVAYGVGRSLQLAFFTGLQMPIFTPEAIATTTNLCGIYSYNR